MDIILIIIATLLLAGIGYAIFLLKNKADHSSELIELKEENARLNTEKSQAENKIGELQEKFENEKSEKDQSNGNNKRMYVEISDLKKDLQVSQEKISELKKELTTINAKAEQERKEHKEEISKLENARKSLEKEQDRVTNEDEAKKEKEKNERDRIWNEHEGEVKRRISDICKSPEYAFQYYDNTNLPEDFDGKLKPDCMIEFLGQYIIFDPKTSRSDNLQTYLDGQVKSTVEKIKESTQINKTIFFVVPTEAVSSLKKLQYYEQGYTFHVISPEALTPIIWSFKEISKYEFAEKLDPQERENIVNLIAEFDNHINFRNAADILLAQTGINILHKANQLVPNLEEEIQQKRSKISLRNLKPTDIKRLMLNRDNQQRDINNIVDPKADIPKEVIESATEMLEE
jgi:hypothetical protein